MRLHPHLKNSLASPRIPDRRVCIMKYRSGNARRALRGAFAFEFLDRISPSFSLRCAEELLCSARPKWLPRVNFPAALKMSTAYFFRNFATSSPSIAPREKEKSNDFVVDAYASMKQSVERSRRSLEAILGAMFIS